jgi:hypothetical protein
VRTTLPELIFGVALDVPIDDPRRLWPPVWFARHRRPRGDVPMSATLSELMFGVAIGEPRRLTIPVWFARDRRGFEEMYL